MGHSKTSRTRINRSERARQALDLRKAGLTFREIGRRMNVTEGRAHQLVTEELARLNKERAEAADEVSRLEMERLDEVHSGIWAKAQAGDPAAIDRVLSIMGRRARLLGLDAPSKSELSGPGQGPLTLKEEASPMGVEQQRKFLLACLHNLTKGQAQEQDQEQEPPGNTP